MFIVYEPLSPRPLQRVLKKLRKQGLSWSEAEATLRARGRWPILHLERAWGVVSPDVGFNLVLSEHPVFPQRNAVVVEG